MERNQFHEPIHDAPPVRLPQPPPGVIDDSDSPWVGLGIVFGFLNIVVFSALLGFWL